MRLADRFALEREVGSGGMARVYLGRDEVLDRPVAVKVLKPMHGDTDIGVRFRREGRTAARLSHPNIVQVYDAGEGDLEGSESEVSYIVMEYLSGGDLKELIDARGSLPGAELARIGEEVCAGLAHAHGRGVVHRDIKPHNILLDEKGRAKVSDFGIARALDTTQATRTGAYLGTALYSSPEQLQGHRVTPKSDVYSLGATLYQAAAGEPPFTGTPIEVASQHVSKPPPPLTEREDDLDLGGDLEALILACLAKDADDRPSAEEAQRRFGEALPTTAVIPGAVPEEPEPEATPATARESRREPRREPQRVRPAPTVASSAGGVQRRRRGGGLLAALALVAVLAVIGAFALPGLLGGGTNTSQGGPSNEQAAAGGSNREDGNEGEGSQGDGGAENAPQPTTPGPEEASAPSEDEPEQNRTGQDGPQQQSESPEQAAAQAVEEFYTAAAAENYDKSSSLLTSGWREQYFPTQTDFETTFGSLRSIRFDGEPAAEVSGNTATVTGQTVATHDDRVERNQGTWTLINSNDRWIISEWTVDPISSRPA